MQAIESSSSSSAPAEPKRQPSPAQVAANRRNGALGGPKTEEGKARSRHNATIHGLTSKLDIVASEDLPMFQTMRDGYIESCDPQTYAETLLVEEVLRTHWRLLRARAYENESWEALLENEKLARGQSTEPSPHNDVRLMAQQVMNNRGNCISNMERNVGRIERAWYKAKALTLPLEDRARRKREATANQSIEISKPANSPHHTTPIHSTETSMPACVADLQVCAGSPGPAQTCPQTTSRSATASVQSTPITQLSENGIGFVSPTPYQQPDSPLGQPIAPNAGTHQRTSDLHPSPSTGVL